MKTDNDIIAEFMQNNAVNSPHLKSPKELAYDTSWDWLMPVVEKIIELWQSPNPRVRYKEVKKLCEMPIITPIDVVYCEVSRFAKWYNQQPK